VTELPAPSILPVTMPTFRQYINLVLTHWSLKIQPLPLDFFVRSLEQNKPVSFARYGDGEWAAILGHKGANCDGHEYSPLLGSALRVCLYRKKGYVYGMQPYAVKNMGREIAGYIKRNNLVISWHNASVFHDANIDGQLSPFVRALRNKKCVVVGPDYMRGLDKQVVRYSDFIEVPRVNCFDAYDSIFAQLLKVANSSSGNVFLFSASMASNVFIHQLYDQFGAANWFLDIGSLWDVYLGVNSRSVYQRQVWDDLIKKNLA
jgi:hypothetical protein